MEKKKHFIVNYITIFGIFFIWVYLLRNVILNTYYESSRILIYLSFIMGFILLPKADIIKRSIYNKKYIKAIIINVIYGIFVILMYLLLKNIYTPEFKTWELTLYRLEDITVYLREFLDYIYLLMTSEIPVINIVIIDIVLGILTIIGSKILENKKSYLLEKVIKKYYKYYYFIIFVISILLISKEYKYPREISYILEATIIIGLIGYLYLYILSKKNLNKNTNKERLIVLYTIDNFEFNFINQISKGLIDFSNYKQEKRINILETKAEDFTVVTQDLIRNNLIDIKQYKNVTYYIKLLASNVENLSKKTLENLRHKIEELQKSNKNFIIVGIEDKESKFLKYLKDKYKQDYKANIVTKEVIEQILEIEKNEKLNIKIRQLLEKYKKIEKTPEKEFIIKTLENMNTSDATRSFYDLLKICEYVIHYRALQFIVNNPEEVKKEDITKTALGKWNKYQDQDNETIKNVELEKALKDIKEKLELNDTIGMNYQKICSILVSLRNKLMAHGSITYEISKKIVYDFAVITEVFIDKFINESEFIEEKQEIKNIFEKNKKAIIKKDNLIYLYNYSKQTKDGSMYEYLNYDTGKIIKENNNYILKLNLKLGEVLNERKK